LDGVAHDRARGIDAVTAARSARSSSSPAVSGRRQQVEIEILLHDGDIGGRERHRLRTDPGRDSLELDALPAALHVDVAPLLDQGEVVGVNRDRQGFVCGKSRRSKKRRPETAGDEEERAERAAVTASIPRARS
jgi:hypothetical protein